MVMGIELNFKQFLELFDSSVETIDWGKSSGSDWEGIFFVPVQGMNPEGAMQLRQKQKQSSRPYDTPPGHIQFKITVKFKFLDSQYLRDNYSPFNFNGPGGRGHLVAIIAFKRQKEGGKNAFTYETPGEEERSADTNLVFGTAIKGTQEVIQKSGANITGIMFKAHDDVDDDKSVKRLRLYQMMAKTLGNRYGLIEVQSRIPRDILLIKKEYLAQQV